MDMQKIRADFPVLKRRENGSQIIYFDNAATSLKPKTVIESICSYYTERCANIHRGLHKMSEEATEEFEQAHKKISSFINAKPEELVLTYGTTHSLNQVMYSLLLDGFFEGKGKILVSETEHHSNLVPWQFIEKKTDFRVEFVRINEDFTLNMGELNEKMSKEVKLVAVSHVSNTLGAINPIEEIGKIAHDNGSVLVVDAAQSVPHIPINVKKLNADFLAFSGHKMLGPTGTGGLFMTKEWAEKLPPFFYGGGMIMEVKEHESSFAESPQKFEAGTPNIVGCIGLGKAIDYLKKIGMETVEAHEKELTDYTVKEMEGIEGVNLYCPKEKSVHLGIISFNVQGINCHDLAMALDELGNIAVRSGMHCAEPLVSKFNPKGVDRASFYLYNTKEEVDIFIEKLKRIAKDFR